ncbi:MAG: zinc-dependent metalloprotease [Pirellulales bacterium]
MFRRPRRAIVVPALSLIGLAIYGASPSAAAAEDLEQSLRKALADVQAAEAAKGDAATAESKEKPAAEAKTPADTAKSADNAKPQAAAAAAPEKPKSKYPPYEDVLKDAQKIPGLITLYRKDDRLLAELDARNLNRDLIVLITIARGIGQSPIVGGFSWQFGDDAVWQFRRAGERIHLVRRNVRFTADKGSPDAEAVAVAYTDSVLYSLPILTRSPGGAYVVDLNPVFMSDLPQISTVLPGFMFSETKSTWANIEGFPKNVELQVAATYASSGFSNIDSVPDARGVTVNVHYSISELPATSYKPRLADDRVGYFVTAKKDFSKKDLDDRFVRYITRWHLEKADADAKVSPPKKPIVFWLDKTIPFSYRKPIRDGILEWNKAFEKAGYYDAIEVRQQPDDATWAAGDVNYNTFQWITAGVGYAMGPSRVNPSTGQILDADIIFDADFLQYWKQEHETFTPESIAMMTGGAIDLDQYRAEMKQRPPYLQHTHSDRCSCNLLSGMSRQLAVGASVMATRQRSPEETEKLIKQGLKECTMHEVGHTLGLRHNFRASGYYSLADLNDPEKTAETGIGMSVMDYNPVNIMPDGAKQGDYFSQTIGPYDMWAIEYGYKPLSGGSPEAELPELKKIASRSGDPRYAFGDDGNARGIDPDPLTNRYDLSSDLVEYAKNEAKLVADAWPKVVEDLTKDGDGYQKARRAFNILLGRHGEVMFAASRYVGGLEVSRSHKGDEKAKEPLVVIPAKKQREALELVEAEVFSDKPFGFPPELYGHLASSQWDHWGVEPVERTDYPAHDVILMWQDRILSRLMSSLTLARIHDSELKVPADEDVLTTAELLSSLTGSIFTEVDGFKAGEFTDRKPAISSLRRNLQRAYLERLSRLAMGQTMAPEDCETVAFLQLKDLKGKIDTVLAGDFKLDTYSRAHLDETSAKIGKVLDATMVVGP